MPNECIHAAMQRGVVLDQIFLPAFAWWRTTARLRIGRSGREITRGGAAVAGHPDTLGARWRQPR